MPTARSNSSPFHDKTFEKQDRSAGVGTEMYKAITATQGSRWTSMMSSSRESSVTRNMPTARSNSRPFHDKTFEKQDRSAGVGTEMYKAITATQSREATPSRSKMFQQSPQTSA